MSANTNQTISVYHRGDMVTVSVMTVVFKSQANNTRFYSAKCLVLYENDSIYPLSVELYIDCEVDIDGTVSVTHVDGDCVGSQEFLTAQGGWLLGELEQQLQGAIDNIPPLDPTIDSTRDTDSPYLAITKTEPDLGEWDLL